MVEQWLKLSPHSRELQVRLPTFSQAVKENGRTKTDSVSDPFPFSFLFAGRGVRLRAARQRSPAGAQTVRRAARQQPGEPLALFGPEPTAPLR